MKDRALDVIFTAALYVGFVLEVFWLPLVIGLLICLVKQ